jgi:TetR/AcrR family transcriptional repressor of nem operon
MRYDTEHKQRTREKVVQRAAEALREHGPDGIGVADLMKKAGLTHGGFYAHFKSKDDLVAEAIAHMFEDRYELFRESMADLPPAQGLARYIDRYLDIRHRERRATGCPMPALSGDVARLPAVARKRFEAGAQRIVDSIADILRALKRPHPEALAQSALAEMVGTISISRAIADTGFAERMLESSRESIKGRLGL